MGLVAEGRPSMKRPGITATGRQWQTIEALRADGWFVLEADPSLWTEADRQRLETALERCRRNEHVSPTEGTEDG